MKCMLHIYIVSSVDWYHHWRNRSSSFGGEANTNYYPSKNGANNDELSFPGGWLYMYIVDECFAQC